MKTDEIQKSWLFDYPNSLFVFVIGSLGYLALILTAHLTNTSFNGVLDVHYIENQSLGNSLVEGFLIVIILILVYTALNYNFSREVNIVGIVNAVLISRLPFIFFTFFNIDHFIRYILIINISKINYQLYNFLFSDLIVLFIFLVIAISILISSVYVLYKGISSATGIRFRKKEKILFFCTLLLAEIASKGVFLVIN